MLQGAWRSGDAGLDASGRPRAIAGQPPMLNEVRGKRLNNIIRQMSGMSRHPLWASGLDARDAVALFMAGGQLGAAARRLFTRISVWAGTTLNVSGEKYEYSPQELCLTHIDESSDLLEKLLLAAGPLYTPQILALEVMPANVVVWHRMAMLATPLRELHLLGDSPAQVIDTALRHVGARLLVLGARCDDADIVKSVARRTGQLEKIVLYGTIKESLLPVWEKNAGTLTQLVLDEDVFDASELELIQTHVRKLTHLDVHSEYDNEPVTRAVRDLYLSYGQQLREAHLYSMEMNDIRAIVAACPMAKVSAALNEDPGAGLLVQEALEALQQSLDVANINFDNDIIYFTGLDEAARGCCFLRELTLVRIEKQTLRIITDFFVMARPALVKLRISDVPRDTVPIFEHIAGKTGSLEHLEYSGAMIPNDTAIAFKEVVNMNRRLTFIRVALTGRERTEAEDKEDGGVSTSDEEYGDGPAGGYGRRYEEEHGAGVFGEYRDALAARGAGPSTRGGGYGANAYGDDSPAADAPPIFSTLDTAGSFFTAVGGMGSSTAFSSFAVGSGAFEELKAVVADQMDGPPAWMRAAGGGDDTPAEQRQAPPPAAEQSKAETSLMTDASGSPGEEPAGEEAVGENLAAEEPIVEESAEGEFCEHSDDSDAGPTNYNDDTPGASDVAAFVQCAYVAPALRELVIEVPPHMIPDPPAIHPVVFDAVRPLKKRHVHTTVATIVYLS